MKRKIAFAGFRHAHISALYRLVEKSPDWEIAASCEENREAAACAEQAWNVKITHDDFHEMLRNEEFDVLAVGDVFSLRGQRIIDGLNAGRNILSDKPLCTSPEELDEICNLAGKNSLKIGMMLDLRHNRILSTARELISHGRIGEIQSIQFGGQHSLSPESRPKWYFEPGKHGGTVNDLGVHALDAAEYLTGHRISGLTAARTWNAFAAGTPEFHDAAQIMFVLDNRCGVIGDISYIRPEHIPSGAGLSWKFAVWGKTGVMEFSADSSVLTVHDADGTHKIAPDGPVQPDYLEIFRKELDGLTPPFGTEHVLSISRRALELQKMASE